MLVLSWVLFTAFSLGCGSAKSMTALYLHPINLQLDIVNSKLISLRITCRSFQGIGASGLYSLTQIGLVEVGPCHRPSLIGALIGATLAVAFVLGPIIGGAVSQLSDWRWLFNLKYIIVIIIITIIICNISANIVSASHLVSSPFSPLQTFGRQNRSHICYRGKHLQPSTSSAA